MEMYELIKRYEGRRIEIVIHGFTRITGEVASVFYDCVRLTDSSTHETLEQDAWSQETAAKWPETVVNLHTITAVTCFDDALRDEPPPGAPPLDNAVASQHNSPDDEDIGSPVVAHQLEVALGAGLIRIADERRGGDLLLRVNALRKSIASECGFLLPKVRIRDDLSLDQCDYSIRVNGAERGRGALQPGKHLAIAFDSRATVQLEGDAVTDPVYGAGAWWVEDGCCERAELLGYTVVEPSAILATHLNQIAKHNAAEILTLEQTSGLLSDVRATHPAIAAEATNRAGVTLIHRVLCALLSEQVCIAHLPFILESLTRRTPQGACDGPLEKPLFHSLIAGIRADIRQTICAPLRDREGSLTAYTLDDTLMSLLTEDCHLKMLPQRRAEIRKAAQKLKDAGAAVIVVEDNQRQQISTALRAIDPYFHVLARCEIPASIELKIAIPPPPQTSAGPPRNHPK